MLRNNPMQLMMQMFGQNGRLPQFDQMMFRQMLPNLNEDMLNRIIQQARMFGISEQEIQEGLKTIRSFRK